MAPAEEKYRRLPGRRRGVINGSSLWMGSDHILLVKTAWFREEYKRFYLRDIQAIVVAPGPRFYFSMPMLLCALLWLFSGFFMGTWPQAVATGWIATTVAVPVAWAAVALLAGCRCRLYTAVSRDELPSLFRTWTARRFLRVVQPRIEQVQGVIAAGWVESENTQTGPLVAAMTSVAPKPKAAPSHTMVSDLFALCLVLGSAVGLATVSSPGLVWSRVNTGLLLLQFGASIAVMVQYSRGKVGVAMQRISVASLLLAGVAFYVQTFTFAYAQTTFAGPKPSLAFVAEPLVLVHQVIYGLNLLLGLLSGIIALRSAYDDEPDIIKD
jgi:hypothetical protein